MLLTSGDRLVARFDLRNLCRSAFRSALPNNHQRRRVIMSANQRLLEGPTVSIDWLHANIGAQGVKVLDATWYLPIVGMSLYNTLSRAHPSQTCRKGPRGRVCCRPHPRKPLFRPRGHLRPYQPPATHAAITGSICSGLRCPRPHQQRRSGGVRPQRNFQCPSCVVDVSRHGSFAGCRP